MFVAATRTELHCTAEMLPATFKLCAAISYQHLRNVTGERPVLWVLLSARLLSALFLGWGTEAVCCSGGAAAPGWAVAPQLLSGRCVLPVCCSEQSLSSTDPSQILSWCTERQGDRAGMAVECWHSKHSQCSHSVGKHIRQKLVPSPKQRNTPSASARADGSMENKSCELQEWCKCD